jgi:hypothetical protein
MIGASLTQSRRGVEHPTSRDRPALAEWSSAGRPEESMPYTLQRKREQIRVNAVPGSSAGIRDAIVSFIL